MNGFYAPEYAQDAEYLFIPAPVTLLLRGTYELFTFVGRFARFLNFRGLAPMFGEIQGPVLHARLISVSCHDPCALCARIPDECILRRLPSLDKRHP